ncbi:hypothetical protein [Thalassomonas haliotis]|uniref:Uncharacterized protein n=1 Tax=Thalassomonas haliotis TaxID=485448 RepID=A0ABY7VIN9_9GAMM|nr:hypothetical protein [Thalassomonas haliotis]WDE13594.1 hypothetical protein H3N35_09245 [Thalassomonas haliotis]
MNIATLPGEKGLLLLPVNANIALNIHLSAALNGKLNLPIRSRAGCKILPVAADIFVVRCCKN